MMKDIPNIFKSAVSVAWNKALYGLNRNKRARVRQLDAWGTVDDILATGCSVSRFGDGELNMVFNYLEDTDDSERASGFQNYDRRLGQRLYEILREGGSVKANHKVALPGCMFGIGTGYLRGYAARFWQWYSNKNLSLVFSVIDCSKKYLETNFSRFYLSHRDKSRCREYIEYVKEIWKGRDVVIIEGEYTRLGVGNDLFAGAKSVGRILCPPRDAWGRYDAIVAKCGEILPLPMRNPLIICALGMTATILSYDLACKGYQAIDLGHIDIEYEWMLMGATEKMPVAGKYTNESAGGDNVSQSGNAAYLAQIIARVE